MTFNQWTEQWTIAENGPKTHQIEEKKNEKRKIGKFHSKTTGTLKLRNKCLHFL